jgi:hypothetical protein
MEDKPSDSTNVSVTVPVKKGGSSLKLILTIAVVVVLVAGAGLGGYFYGVSVGQSSFPRNMQFARGQFGQQGAQSQNPNQTAQPRNGFGGGQPGGGVSGSIASIDGTTITVTTRTGSVKVNTTDTTLIEKYASVTVADLAVGEQIIVTGSTNDDGSVTARSIQTMRGVEVSPNAQP